MSYCLVHPDLSFEHNPGFNVGCCFGEGRVAETEGFAGEEAALGIHSVENHFEILVFCADEG